MYSLILESAQNPASRGGGVGRRPRLQNPAKSGAVAARSSRSWAGSLAGCQAPRLAPRLTGFTIVGAQVASLGRRESSGAKHLLQTGLDTRLAGAPQAAHQNQRTFRSPGRRSPRAGARAEAETFHDTLSSACGGTPRVEHESTTNSACGRTLQAGSASPP